MTVPENPFNFQERSFMNTQQLLPDIWLSKIILSPGIEMVILCATSDI